MSDDPQPSAPSSRRRILRPRAVAGVGAAAAAAVVAAVLVPGHHPDRLDAAGGPHTVRVGQVAVTTNPGPDDACVTSTFGSGAEPLTAKLFFKASAMHIGTTALDFAQDEAMGWALKKITGEKSVTPEQIEAINTSLEKTNEAVQDLAANVSDLQQQMVELRQTIADDFNDQKTDGRINTLTTAVATVTTDSQEYASIIKDSGNTTGWSLSDHATDAGWVLGMRNDLGVVINTIIGAMHGGSGQETLPALWNRGFWHKQGHTGEPPTDVYSSEFIDSAYKLTDYYSSVLVEALRLYAEANRVDFTHGGDSYVEEPGHVCDEYAVVMKALDDFMTWSTNGTGHIPDGTVVDLRNGKSLLWSEHSIRPIGGFSDYYCGDADGYCYVDQYADLYGQGLNVKDPRTDLVNTWAVRDMKLVNGKLSTLGGWTDWRVPTTADINALQTGPMTGGLTAWGTANDTSIFDPEQVTVRGNTAHDGQQVGVITPILVDPTAPGTGDRVFDLYTAMPTDTKLSKVVKPASDGSQAGRLFVVRDFVKETDGAGMPDDSTQPVHSADPARATLADFNPAGEPKTFSTASSCSANAYPVPAGVTALKVSAQGGAGGTGRTMQNSDNGAPTGGRGATVDAIIPVIPGTTVYAQVGGNGQGWQSGAGGIGGGGTGGQKTSTSQRGSGGGGMSGISTDTSCDQWLLVAAGGGGSGDGGTNGRTSQANGGRGGDADNWQGTQTPGNGENHYTGTGPSKYAGNTEPCTTGAGRAFPARGGGNPGIGYAGDQCGRWGGDGTWFAGGNGGDAVTTGSGTGGVAGSAGGGGGAGFWSGGGGGASGHYLGSGAGGAGGVSYVTNPDAWGIDSKTISMSVSDAAPKVTITPLSGTPATAVNLAVSSYSISPNQQLVMTATMRDDVEGDVTFIDEVDGELGQAKIINGRAELSKQLPAGLHVISAYFAGFGPYGSGISSTIAVNVAKATPSILIGLSAKTVSGGKTPVITITLPKDATGSVIIDDNSTGQEIGLGVVHDGTAIVSSFNQVLTPGVHQLSAFYTGDGTYNDGHSDPVTLTVQP